MSSKKPSKSGRKVTTKVQSHHEAALAGKNHMDHWNYLAGAHSGPVAKGVGSARGRSKKKNG